MHIIYNSNSKKIWAIENPDWNGDWCKKFEGTWNSVEAYRVNGESEGVPYAEELAGPAGASFIFFSYTSTHDKNLAKAVDKIKRERDVVRMRVIRGILQG